MRASDGPVPAVDYVASFLCDAARLEASVWTVVNVIKQFLDDGLRKDDALRAADAAGQRCSPGQTHLIDLYRNGIRDLVAPPQSTATDP